MRISKLLYVLFFVVKNVSAQYSVQAFHDVYQEIEDYSSVQIDTEGDLFWEKEFNFDFMFPLFDVETDYLLCNVEGLCYLDDDIDFSLRLMAFGYRFDSTLDINNIPSDVRYKYGELGGKKYLVMQWTKVRLFSDPSVEEYDSHVNFQYWFFEDGTIELRFGLSNLEHSPVYVPGEGFYLIPDNTDPILAGPELALYHPYDESIRLEYNDLDSYEEYELEDGLSDSGVSYWPAEGWVIRFTNTVVSTVDLGVDQDAISVLPNPNSGTFILEGAADYVRYELTHIDGRVVQAGLLAGHEFTGIASGMYFLTLQTRDATRVTKRVVVR